MNKDHINYFWNKYCHIYPLSHVLWRTFESTKLAKFNVGKKVLDIGCGDASYASIFFNTPSVNRFKEIIGLDIDEKDCEKAKKAEFYNEVICSPSHKISYEDGYFDMIFSNSVFEHIEKIDDTLVECNRVLRVSGKLLFSAPSDTFSENLFFYKFFNYFGLKLLANKYANFVNGEKIFIHHNLFSVDEWQKRLEKNGFRIVQVEYMLHSRTEKIWDIFLTPSLIQHVVAKKFGVLPFQLINKLLSKKLIDYCMEVETKQEKGGNIIIYAEKL